MKVETYEKEAIELLCSDLIPNSILHEAILFPNDIHCKFTGAGYYLEIKHSDLPADRTVCDKPVVIGWYQNREVGFVAFVENNSICLECYSYDSKSIPAEIRNGMVATISKGK